MGAFNPAAFNPAAFNTSSAAAAVTATPRARRVATNLRRQRVNVRRKR